MTIQEVAQGVDCKYRIDLDNRCYGIGPVYKTANSVCAKVATIQAQTMLKVYLRYLMKYTCSRLN